VEQPVPVEVLIRPWRTATLVASAVAAVELVIILVAGVVLVGKPLTEKMHDAARDRTLGVPAAAPAKKPKIGEVVSVIPNHCCVVTNMMDEVYAARKGKIEAVYPVAARGKVR